MHLRRSRVGGRSGGRLGVIGAVLALVAASLTAVVATPQPALGLDPLTLPSVPTPPTGGSQGTWVTSGERPAFDGTLGTIDVWQTIVSPARIEPGESFEFWSRAITVETRDFTSPTGCSEDPNPPGPVPSTEFLGPDSLGRDWYGTDVEVPILGPIFEIDGFSDDLPSGRVLPVDARSDGAPLWVDPGSYLCFGAGEPFFSRTVTIDTVRHGTVTGQETQGLESGCYYLNRYSLSSFRFRLDEIESSSGSWATLKVGVDNCTVPENRPPVAVDDSAITLINESVEIDVAANDSDPDENLDPSTVAISSLPGNGAAEAIGPGSIRYSPSADFVGDDSFSYAICDTDGACDSAEVQIEVLGVVSYRVELRAWIPQASVVDPKQPVSAFPRLSSVYRGDGHLGFDGTFRASAWIEFEWDGTEIANVVSDRAFGTTYRDEVWCLGRLCRDTREKTHSKTAKEDAGSDVTSTDTFEIWIDAGNPMVRPASLVPNISSNLTGQVTNEGLELSWSTDLFPSHGLRVWVNDEVRASSVIMNVACVETLGLEGAENLATRLLLQENNGLLHVSTSGPPIDSILPCV